MAKATTLFVVMLLYAGYSTQLCFRQPSHKTISQRSESRLMWIAVSRDSMYVVRIGTLGIYFYHALVSLVLAQGRFNDEAQLLYQICPTPQYLDRNLFAWSKKSIGLLTLLYVGCYVRFQAYAQLGINFTYRIAAPDALVTEGVYAYVRHPSYSGLFAVLIALYALFLTQHGALSCWLPATSTSFGRYLIDDTTFAYLLPGVGFTLVVWLVMMRRVQEEEAMMEREFGQRWREYRKRTKKFVPFLI